MLGLVRSSNLYTTTMDLYYRWIFEILDGIIQIKFKKSLGVTQFLYDTGDYIYSSLENISLKKKPGLIRTSALFFFVKKSLSSSSFVKIP